MWGHPESRAVPYRRIPPDVARVMEVFHGLGDAARRALWLSEKVTEAEVREAVRRATALRKELRRR